MSKQAGCPAETTLLLIAGRWKPLIIHWLIPGAMRFNELQRSLGSITHRTLSRTLKEMEGDGLVERCASWQGRVGSDLRPVGERRKPELRCDRVCGRRRDEADHSFGRAQQ